MLLLHLVGCLRYYKDTYTQQLVKLRLQFNTYHLSVLHPVVFSNMTPKATFHSIDKTLLVNKFLFV